MKNTKIKKAELNLIETGNRNTIKIAIVIDDNLGDVFKFEVETTGGNCRVQLVSQWHSTDELQTYINLMNGELPRFSADAINVFADKIKESYKVLESKPSYNRFKKAPAKKIAAKKK